MAMTGGIEGTYAWVTRMRRSAEESLVIRQFSQVDPWIFFFSQ